MTTFSFHKTTGRLSASCPIAVILVCLLSQPASALEISVVNQHGQPLQHAVVTAATNGSAHMAPDDAEIAQSMQQFLPRVTVVAQGSQINFPNRDTTQHHVYSFSEAKQFELALYKGESPNPIRFENPGIVALGCNIHDWMLGYVYITEDPLFATTAADGTLNLDVAHEDVETLTVWHPASISFAPQEIPLATFPGNREPLSIVIETSAEDPLEFEIDPLQQLFEVPGE